MNIDIKNLQKLINLCRKMGVLELELEGTKIKLSPDAYPQKRSKDSKAQEVSEQEFSDDDITFWSASQFDGAN